MSTSSSKDLIRSKILWSSVVSAGLSVLVASLNAPADCPPIVLKLLASAAAMASTAAAIFRSMDASQAKKDEATREHKAMQ